MVAITSPLPHSGPNRRLRVRHKIRTPAYASFADESSSAMLDLHEIVNISEDGVAIQCHTPLEADQRLSLCLDLAGCGKQIYTTGKVIWAGTSRAGIHLSELPADSVSRLRDWFQVNESEEAAGDGEAADARPLAEERVPPSLAYSDALAAVTAVQREVESLGSDLGEALRLIAARAQTLLRGSGAALALAHELPDSMICRASSGPDAPPVGARLHVGSGFSGECVRSGSLLTCSDSEHDFRVDHEACRALGIRSIVAAPVRLGETSIGLLEVFSPLPNAFTESDRVVLQRLSETTVAAVSRTARAGEMPLRDGPSPVSAVATPGSILFASAPNKETEEDAVEKSFGGVRLPRSYLIILVCAAATIAMALGYRLAPWIQSKLEERGRARLQTVLASSQAQKSRDTTTAARPSVETATIEQLKQMAANGDPASENALGLRYSQGDEKNGIRQDETEAFRWFSRAAEDGSLAAQAKLGFLYSQGQGVPKDVNRAYFWAVLARARGDQGNKELATVLASGMTRSQAAAIEQQADIWLQQHPAFVKPAGGR